MKIIKKIIDFTGEKFFIGIDVHKEHWTITIRNNGIILKTFTMEPLTINLINYLKRNYPGGEFYSVYEAGFCGYWIDNELKRYGIHNIIVNPSDIPTRSKERITKTDPVDSKKLSRELENGTLKAIYIPETNKEQFRTLCRLRYQLVTNQIRLKNRIKSLLAYYGITVPKERNLKTWSKKYIEYLNKVELPHKLLRESLNIHLEELSLLSERIERVIMKLKECIKEYGVEREIIILTGVPGIGFVTAITLYTEIMDINRFNRFDELCSYVGLVPAVHSSGQRERIMGISNRQSKYLRNLIIEAAWTAIKKDPAMTIKFNELCKRMCKQKAIIRIAKKLLSRIASVWKNNIEYQLAVVQ